MSETTAAIERTAGRKLGLGFDELTVHLIATGLIRLADDVQRGKPVMAPYPIPLQRGLDRLALACIRRSLPPPQGVPELLEWCAHPIASWGLELAGDALGEHDSLLLDSAPTSVCDSWARVESDIEAELTQSHIIFSVFRVCQQNNDQAGYVAFRRLLIEHPVLSALDLQLHCIAPQLARLAEHIREAYEEAPASWSQAGNFHTCVHCANLLQPLDNGSWLCENPRCSRRRIEEGRTFAAAEGVLWLKRGLRRFTAAPGLVELELANKLAALGLQVELWPKFDSYDLRVVFADRQAWAVDVKDWANPFLLARSLGGFREDPVWERAFYVFPDERRQERSDYGRAFNANWRQQPQVQALFVRDFLKSVRQRLEGAKPDA
jgi:hypothetical protein